MGINTKDSEAEVAFSDTAAELNLSHPIIRRKYSQELAEHISITINL